MAKNKTYYILLLGIKINKLEDVFVVLLGVSTE